MTLLQKRDSVTKRVTLLQKGDFVTKRVTLLQKGWLCYKKGDFVILVYEEKCYIGKTEDVDMTDLEV